MNSPDIYKGLERLYSILEGPSTGNGAGELRIDNASRITLAEIDESEGSKELIKLLRIGARVAPVIGRMTLAMGKPEVPTMDENGKFIFTLGGKAHNGDIIGATLTVEYDLEETVTDVSVVPSFTTVRTLRGVFSAAPYLDAMIGRDPNRILQDATVMIELGMKAIGFE